MNEDVKKALKKSAQDFIDVVYPLIKKPLGDGKLIPVQDVTENEMATILDQYSGIDAWYIENSKGIRGLSSRIQYVETDEYKSFTIRKERESGAKTEYEKLTYAIQENWLYPYWFCQAYLHPTTKKPHSAGLCKTTDLIKYISEGKDGIDYTVKEVSIKGRATFFVVNWQKFKKKYPMYKFPEDTLAKHILGQIKKPKRLIVNRLI